MKLKLTTILFILISACTTLSAQKKGDVNGDGSVNISDVVAVINIIANGSEDDTDEPINGDGLCPDSNHPHIIDLGIGVKWACCNVGASKPEQYGGYYAWGETNDKSIYHYTNYSFFNTEDYNNNDKDWTSCFMNIGNDIEGTSYDVAKEKWGNNWHIPSQEDINILLKECSDQWININGVYGRKFTGPNGNSIFFPAAGRMYYDEINDEDNWGYYWSSVQDKDNMATAYSLNINSEGTTCNAEYNYRYLGFSVRPVTKTGADTEDPTVEAGLCPDSNHPHIIDLGECGKWACCNVGASSPLHCGDYYAWGESEVKSSYDWKTYLYCDGDYSSCYDLGKDISGTKYDVAFKKWGEEWQMPSLEQIKKLYECSKLWTSIGGVDGLKLTGSNGYSIFLPAAGNKSQDSYNGFGIYGNYWSSSLHPNTNDYACCFHFENNNSYWDRAYARANGFTVRPIVKTEESIEEPTLEESLCPDSNHPHIVDFGEGGKWACCNVGASTPWEYGNYYAWSETEEKNSYTLDNYHSGVDESTFEGFWFADMYYYDISSSLYDVANTQWGDGWCMPGLKEIIYISNICQKEWVSINDIYGIKLTDPNSGNQLFLPAGGWKNGTDIIKQGEKGSYWSSWYQVKSRRSYITSSCMGLTFEYDDRAYCTWDRLKSHLGGLVRPIKKQ